MLKKILLVIVGLVVVGAGAAMMMPSKWHVERSVTVKAKPETIYTSVADLKQWDSWTSWNTKRDPTMKREFSGAALGAGAKMTWDGKEMRQGELTVTKGDPKTGIQYDMKFGTMPASGSVTFTADGEGTKVTWAGDGDVGMMLPMRFMLGGMQDMMGKEFDEGLGKLKATSEKAQVAADEAAAAAAAKAKADEEAKAAAEAAAKAAEEAAKNPGK